MRWFNVFGFILMAILIVPNTVYFTKRKEGAPRKWNNKIVGIIEQIGRVGCTFFMIINIPGWWSGWGSGELLTIYLIVNTGFVAVYCMIWTMGLCKDKVIVALALSGIPSALFLFSGIIIRYVPLILAALMFASSQNRIGDVPSVTRSVPVSRMRHSAQSSAQPRHISWCVNVHQFSFVGDR